MKSISANILFYISFLGITLTMVSCEKEDTTDPVITVNEPAVGDILTLSVDPEVHIEIDVSDETSLHEMSVEVKDAAGNIIFSDAPTVHDLKNYSYHEHFEPAGIAAETDMTLTVSVSDHADHEVTAAVSFKVKP